MDEVSAGAGRIRIDGCAVFGAGRASVCSRRNHGISTIEHAVVVAVVVDVEVVIVGGNSPGDLDKDQLSGPIGGCAGYIQRVEIAVDTIYASRFVSGGTASQRP